LLQQPLLVERLVSRSSITSNTAKVSYGRLAYNQHNHQRRSVSALCFDTTWCFVNCCSHPPRSYTFFSFSHSHIHPSINQSIAYSLHSLSLQSFVTSSPPSVQFSSHSLPRTLLEIISHYSLDIHVAWQDTTLADTHKPALPSQPADQGQPAVRST
jgi:hypothetical protein